MKPEGRFHIKFPGKKDNRLRDKSGNRLGNFWEDWNEKPRSRSTVKRWWRKYWEVEK